MPVPAFPPELKGLLGLYLTLLVIDRWSVTSRWHPTALEAGALKEKSLKKITGGGLLSSITESKYLALWC